MTYRGFQSRAEIGLRSPRSVSHNITPQNGGVAGHYAGPAQNVDSHDDCLRLWRGYQAYHMDKHGWVDIAYTLGVCDHGYILAGRGAGVRTAANGSNTGNQNYYAVCWIGGNGETPTQDAVDAFWQAVRFLRSQGHAGNLVRRHSDFKSTSCPGSLGPVIDAGIPEEDDMTPEQDQMLKRIYEELTSENKSGTIARYVSTTNFAVGRMERNFGPGLADLSVSEEDIDTSALADNISAQLRESLPDDVIRELVTRLQE